MITILKGQHLLDSRSLNFTADTTSGDKPLDAELNFDVYHVHNKLFKHTFKLWDAGHVTTYPKEEGGQTHFTDNLSIHTTHTETTLLTPSDAQWESGNKSTFLRIQNQKFFGAFLLKKTK